MSIESPIQKLDYVMRASAPLLSCIFFLLLALVPWPSPILKTVLSTFVLMVLCYWVVHKPNFFPVQASFLIGLTQDVLMGQPIGITAFTYLAADLFLRSQRQFFLQQSFRNLWLMFFVIITGASALQWGVASVITGRTVDAMPWMFKVLLGVLFFPFMASVLHLMQRWLLGRI